MTTGEDLVNALREPDAFRQNVDTAKKSVGKAASELRGDPTFGELADDLQQASREEDADTVVEVLDRLAQARSNS